MAFQIGIKDVLSTEGVPVSSLSLGLNYKVQPQSNVLIDVKVTEINPTTGLTKLEGNHSPFGLMSFVVDTSESLSEPEKQTISDLIQAKLESYSDDDRELLLKGARLGFNQATMNGFNME